MRLLAGAVALLAMGSGCIPFAVEGLHGGENIRATLAGQPPRVLRSHSPDRGGACWAPRRSVYADPDPWKDAPPGCTPPPGWNALLLPVNLVSLASLGFTPSVLVLDDAEALGGTDRFTRVMRGWHVDGGGHPPDAAFHFPWIFFFWPGTWEPGREPRPSDAPPEYFEALLDHPDPEVRSVAVRHLASCSRAAAEPYGLTWLVERALDETDPEARRDALAFAAVCVGDCTAPRRGRRRGAPPPPLEPDAASRIRPALLSALETGGSPGAGIVPPTIASSALTLLACVPELADESVRQAIATEVAEGRLLRGPRALAILEREAASQARPADRAAAPRVALDAMPPDEIRSREDTEALMREVDRLGRSGSGEDEVLRRKLVARLARLEPPLAPPTLWLHSRLQELIEDRSHALRADVRLLLGCGRTTLDVLDQEAPSERFRAAGLRTLCSEPLASDPRAERLLAEGLRDESEHVRTAAALTLLARGDASPAVISAAVAAIFPAPPRTGDGVDPLEERYFDLRGGPGAMEWVELFARAGDADAPARPGARRCPWLVTVPYPHFEGPSERVSPEALDAIAALLRHPDAAIREATVATLVRLVATRPDVTSRWPHIRARLAADLTPDLPSSL